MFVCRQGDRIEILFAATTMEKRDGRGDRAESSRTSRVGYLIDRARRTLGGGAGAGRPLILPSVTSQLPANSQALCVRNRGGTSREIKRYCIAEGFSHWEAFVQGLIYSIGVIVVSIVIVALL